MKLEQLLSNAQPIEVNAIKDTQAARELQSLLAAAGFLPTHEVDGVVGERTLKAFATFKESVWLDSPELISKSSLEKLISLTLEQARDKPSDETTPQDKDLGIKVLIPCVNKVVYTNQPIIEGGDFTWGEATHNGTRIPADKTIVAGIERIAKRVQPYRDKLGVSFQVTSWYRPPHINKQCGGSTYSRHLSGDALDLLIIGYNGSQLAHKVFKDWSGGMGIYRNFPNLLHVDARSGLARWGPGISWP